MSIRILTILLLCLALGGCAEFTAVTTVGEKTAVKAADANLETAIKIFCNAQSTGAVRRKFSEAERTEYFSTCSEMIGG